MCWRGHRAYTVNVRLALPEAVVRTTSLFILNAAARHFKTLTGFAVSHSSTICPPS
jgi:hypothetical protein